MGKTILIFLLTLLVACQFDGPSSSGLKVLLPWQNLQGEYELQEVELTGLADPAVLSAPHLQVYYNSSIGSEDVHGKPAHPNHTIADNSLVIPLDVKSSMAYSAYVHYTHFHALDRKLALPQIFTTGQKVVVELNTVKESNNAFYLGLQNGGAVGVKKHIGESLPIAYNPGVLAHEHFHAYFSEYINKRLPQEKEGHQNKLTLSGELSIYKFNRDYVLRAWNEAFADFMGYVYSGKKDFISLSLPEHAVARNLDGELTPLIDEIQFENLILGKTRSLTIVGPGSTNTEKKLIKYTCSGVACSYLLGARIARFLVMVSEANPQWGVDDLNSSQVLLKHIISSLPEVYQLVEPDIYNRKIQLAEVLDILFSDSTFAKDIPCESFEMLTSSSGMQTSVGGCLP